MNTSPRLVATLLLAWLAVAPSAGIAGAQAPKGALPARKIPGITAADTHPGACVDCHVNDKLTNHDTRFSTLMKGWTSTVPPALLAQAKGAAPKGMVLKGKHPAVPASGLRNVPGSCRACHGQTSKMAPPLGPMMHVIHLTGGEKNTFLTMFQGECTLCHKLDRKSGAWTIPSGPEK